MTATLVWSGLAVAALGHGFLWTGLVNRLHGLSGPRPVIKLLTLAAFLAIRRDSAGDRLGVLPGRRARVRPVRSRRCGCRLPLAHVGHRRRSPSWSNRGSKPIATTARCCRSGRLDVRDVAKLAWRKPLSGAVATVLGSLPLNEALTLSIDRKRLALPRLPEELEGLTIVHLSDLHMTGRLDRGVLRSRHAATERPAARRDRHHRRHHRTARSACPGSKRRSAPCALRWASTLSSAITTPSSTPRRLAKFSVIAG